MVGFVRVRPKGGQFASASSLSPAASLGADQTNQQTDRHTCDTTHMAQVVRIQVEPRRRSNRIATTNIESPTSPTTHHATTRHTHTRHSIIMAFIATIIIIATFLPLASSTPSSAELDMSKSYQYMYSIAPTIPHEIDVSWPGWTIAAITTLSDDVGSDEVNLPFSFPFWGNQRKLWILPNGAVSFNGPNVQCCTSDGCYFVNPPNSCTLNSTSFSNIIMPCMTDLDPGLTEAAQVYYRLGPDRFDLRFEAVPVWNQYPTGFGYSFGMSLLASGEIQFRFYNVTDPTPGHTHWFDDLYEDPSNPKSFREWIVGLRGASMSTRDLMLQQLLGTVPFGNGSTPAAVAESQYSIEMDQWDTDHAGAYPTRADVQNNRTISWCFIATTFCLWPTIGHPLKDTDIYITAHDLTCASVNRHEFSCRFRSSTSPIPRPTPSDDDDSTPSTSPISLGDNTYYDLTAVYLDEFDSLVCTAPNLSVLRAAGFPTETKFRVSLVDRSASNRQKEIFMEYPLYFAYNSSAPIDDDDEDDYDGSSFDPIALTQGLCGACMADNTDFCWQDCWGEFRGNATLDRCGQCSGGTSGIRANKDRSCSGQCFEQAEHNRTSAECFCANVYQRQITSESAINSVAETNIYSSLSRRRSPNLSMSYDSRTLMLQLDDERLLEEYYQQNDPNLYASLTQPSDLTLDSDVFREDELPSIKADDIPVFRSHDLPQPVPALCTFESRDELQSTFESPMLRYEIFLIVAMIVALISILVRREFEKSTGVGRGALLPVTQSAHHAAPPIIHLPTPRNAPPHTPERTPTPSAQSEQRHSAPVVASASLSGAPPPPLLVRGSSLSSHAMSTSLAPVGSSPPITFHDRALTRSGVPLSLSQFEMSVATSIRSPPRSGADLAGTDSNPDPNLKKRSKADRRIRRAMREARLAQLRDSSPDHRPVVTTRELPAIEEILEEHRIANAAYGRTAAIGIATRQMQQRTPSEDDGQQQPPYSFLASSSLPPLATSINDTQRRFHKASKKAAIPRISPPPPVAHSSAPVTPSSIPPAFVFDPILPSTNLSSSLAATTIVPDPPISSNYWPTYDTNQDFGYRYVRCRDDEEETVAVSAAPAEAPPPAADPFEFDMSGAGFEIGQSIKKKTHANTTTNNQTVQTTFTMPIFSFTTPPQPATQQETPTPTQSSPKHQ